jgi:hypothetical protein
MAFRLMKERGCGIDVVLCPMNLIKGDKKRLT